MRAQRKPAASEGAESKPKNRKSQCAPLPGPAARCAWVRGVSIEATLPFRPGAWRPPSWGTATTPRKELHPKMIPEIFSAHENAPGSGRPRRAAQREGKSPHRPARQGAATRAFFIRRGSFAVQSTVLMPVPHVRARQTAVATPAPAARLYSCLAASGSRVRGQHPTTAALWAARRLTAAARRLGPPRGRRGRRRLGGQPRSRPRRSRPWHGRPGRRTSSHLRSR